MKALNTMDTLVTENGRARVRHYLLDVGSTFGIGANGPREWTEGHEYLFERDKTLKRMAAFGFYFQPWQKIPYEEYPSIGRFEGDHFDPEAWKTRVPVSALLRAREDDLFWAARRVMAFSDEMIREIVKTGQYSDAAAADHLANTLIKRRDKIGQTYFGRLNPLTDFALSPTGQLTFSNAAVQLGLAKPPGSYSVSWLSFDNSSGATALIVETQGSMNQQVPQALPSAVGSFILAEVRAVDAPHDSWTRPVKVYFRRAAAGWKLVGLERMPSNIEPPTTPTQTATGAK
jgi:hypothetical protein